MQGRIGRAGWVQGWVGTRNGNGRPMRGLTERTLLGRGGDRVCDLHASHWPCVYVPHWPSVRAQHAERCVFMCGTNEKSRSHSVLPKEISKCGARTETFLEFFFFSSRCVSSASVSVAAACRHSDFDLPNCLVFSFVVAPSPTNACVRLESDIVLTSGLQLRFPSAIKKSMVAVPCTGPPLGRPLFFC